MKNFWLSSVAVVALSGSMFADTIINTGTSTGTFLTTSAAGFPAATPVFNGAIPAGFINAEQPIFWNDPSYDANNNHNGNIGYVLTGAVVGNVLGTDTAVTGGNLTYYGENAASAQDPIGGATPLGFNFVRNATAYNISILFSSSSMNSTTVFGTYTGSGGSAVFTPIYTGPGNNLTGTPNNSKPFTATGTYGFYAKVCYADGGCETYTTGIGNIDNGIGADTGANAWNHFALFQLASGSFVLGLEDGNGLFAEGIGDFNDIIVELQVVPEPGTMAIMGLGLAGLGLLTRRRFAKK